VWQWIHDGARLNDGREITRDLAEEFLQDELRTLREEVGEEAYNSGKYVLAATLFREVALKDEWVDFLTIAGYRYLD
jgi:malate synthase